MKKKFLLCLDNADMAIKYDIDEFLNFLEEMYDECQNLYIVVTSSHGIDCLPNNQIFKP